MDEQKRILRLAAEIANTDLQALEEGWRRRLLILEGQIEALRLLESAYRERLADIDAAIVHLRALYRINRKVLNIVNAPKAGEDGWQKGNSSNRCRTLDVLSKRTR